MTSAQVRLFSQKAADSHTACWGEPCDYHGVEITVVCQPLNDLELDIGGFSENGRMKALIQGDIIPNLHDRLGIRGKTWVVKAKIENLSSVETALVLEAVPAIRDL